MTVSFLDVLSLIEARSSKFHLGEDRGLHIIGAIRKGAFLQHCVQFQGPF
jgi:hypothetical protein